VSWMHWGDPFGIPDGFGALHRRARRGGAAAARNIMITGAERARAVPAGGGPLHGVPDGCQAQFIEGVAVLADGAAGATWGATTSTSTCAGTLQGTRASCRKNSMHRTASSAAWWCTPRTTSPSTSNVAYNTSGHCYLIEEGGETESTRSSTTWASGNAVCKSSIAPRRVTPARPHSGYTNMANNYITRRGRRRR